MSVQSTYTKLMRQAIAGMIAHDFGPADTTNFTVAFNDAAEEIFIPFGRFVQRGDEGDTGAPDAGGELYRRQTIINGVDDPMTNASIIGVTIRQLMQPNALHQIPGMAHSASTETQAIVRQGYIFVDLGIGDTPANAVAGGTVWVDPANGATYATVSNDDGTNENVQISGAVFEAGAIAGDIVLIRVALNQPFIPAP